MCIYMYVCAYINMNLFVYVCTEDMCVGWWVCVCESACVQYTDHHNYQVRLGMNPELVNKFRPT